MQVFKIRKAVVDMFSAEGEAKAPSIGRLDRSASGLVDDGGKESEGVFRRR